MAACGGGRWSYCSRIPVLVNVAIMDPAPENICSLTRVSTRAQTYERFLAGGCISWLITIDLEHGITNPIGRSSCILQPENVHAGVVEICDFCGETCIPCLSTICFKPGSPSASGRSSLQQVEMATCAGGMWSFCSRMPILASNRPHNGPSTENVHPSVRNECNLAGRCIYILAENDLFRARIHQPK